MGGLLALDLATKTGWAWGLVPATPPATALEAAISKPPQPESGVYKVTGDGVGAFLADFERWLSDQIDRLQPSGLIYEAPILPNTTSFETALKLMSLAGITAKIAHERRIAWVRHAQPASVKKHFTGSGKAKKEHMEAACRRRGWLPQDDNHADAMALLSFGCTLAHAERARARASS